MAKTSKIALWIEGEARAGHDITFTCVQAWAAANGEDSGYARAQRGIETAKRRLKRNHGLLFRNVTKGGYAQTATYRIVNRSAEDYRQAYDGNRRQALAYSREADNVVSELNDGYFEPDISDILQPLAGEHIVAQLLKVDEMVMFLPPEQRARAYGMFIARGSHALESA